MKQILVILFLTTSLNCCHARKDYSGWTVQELEEEKIVLEENINKLKLQSDSEKFKKLEENIQKNKIELNELNKEFDDLKNIYHEEHYKIRSVQWKNIKPELVKLREEKLKIEKIIDTTMNKTSTIVQKIIKGQETTTKEVNTITDVEFITENSNTNDQTTENLSREEIMDVTTQNNIYAIKDVNDTDENSFI